MLMTLPMYIVYWIFTHLMIVMPAMLLMIIACMVGAWQFAFEDKKLIDILCPIVKEAEKGSSNANEARKVL